MTIDEALKAVEQVLLVRTLNPIERFIFQQSWLGRNYHEMAQECSYGTTYLKEVGSQLWQDLTKGVGEKVTKKNLHLVLRQYKRHLAESNIISHPQLNNPPLFTAENLSVQAVELPGVLFDYPSGPVLLNSPLYIERPPIEAQAFAEITQPGCALRIRAPRKMGKSSLLVRLLAHAAEQNYETVYVDFREADESIFESLGRLLRWFCLNVSRQLDLNPLLTTYWDENMGIKVSCKVYFSNYLLEQIYSPIVLVLNELNRLYDYPAIADDFLSMLRLWHEQTKQESTWRKLRLVLAQSTEVYGGAVLRHSPFNVGLSLTLPPFTLEQVQTLALRYQLSWAEGETGKQRLLPLQQLLGGHPYFVNLALYHLHQSALTLEELLATATDPEGIYGQDLRETLTIIQSDPALSEAIQQLVHKEGFMHLDAKSTYHLESLGIVQLKGTLAKLSCELYRLYFRKHLTETDLFTSQLVLAN